WFLRRIDAIHPTRFRTSSATQTRPGSRRAGESQCAGFVLGPCPCAAAAVSSSAVCQRKISELPSDRMEHVAGVLPSGEKPIGPTPPACPSSVNRPSPLVTSRSLILPSLPSAARVREGKRRGEKTRH